MKNFYLLFVILIFTLLSSCDQELTTPNFTNGTSEEVEIRIDNQSSFIMQHIIVNTGSNRNTYPWVGGHGNSTFQSFFYAYPTVSISFLIGTKQFNYVDRNDADREKLEAGKYNLLVYDIDTLHLGFSFRLEEE